MFLYLNITINDKKLVTSVYSKPANSHHYLDGASCHPTKSINGISTRVTSNLNKYALMTMIF